MPTIVIIDKDAQPNDIPRIFYYRSVQELRRVVTNLTQREVHWGDYPVLSRNGVLKITAYQHDTIADSRHRLGLPELNK